MQTDKNKSAGGESKKPLGTKSYGSIPHLPGSRVGPGDHTCHEGQAKIATEKPRDKNDVIYVQEKLDGSNCAIARIGDTLYPITRSGYLAADSPYSQHHAFAEWAGENTGRIMSILEDGERLCGEWLWQAHGTRYKLRHEPFVAFDIMKGHKRMCYPEFGNRIAGNFQTPATIARYGCSLSLDVAKKTFGEYGCHGAIDPIEGFVWRVERIEKDAQRVDFLVKYVRPDKVDGFYLPEISGGEPVYNDYR